MLLQWGLVSAMLVAASITSIRASIPCNGGFVEYECPDDYPICCSWRENGVIAACCPEGAMCDLDIGFCVIQNISNATNGPAPTAQGGITLAVSEAAAFITFGAIGFIVALVGCIFLAIKSFMCVRMWRERREQQLQEEEQERLLDEEDEESDEAPSEGTTEEKPRRDSVVSDDEAVAGQCTVCTVKRSNCVLMTCGHVCTCRPCAAKLVQCPICRKDIAVVKPLKNKIFLSRCIRASSEPSAPAAEPQASTSGLHSRSTPPQPHLGSINATENTASADVSVTASSDEDAASDHPSDTCHVAVSPSAGADDHDDED